MTRRLLPLWLTIWLPFMVLPWVTIAQNRFHIGFHLIYIVVIAASIWFIRDFVRTAPSRSQRAISRTLFLTQSIALAGHVGELIASVRTLLADGYTATNGTWIFDEDPFHVWVANLTVPAITIGLVVLLVLTITAYIQDSKRSAAA